MNKIRFTEIECDDANDAWGFNCGPAALCAVLDMSPAEIRPHLFDFERKGYSNPTMIKRVLDGRGVKWEEIYRGDDPNGRVALMRIFSGTHTPRENFTRWFVMRVQWGGPWTRPGVPMRVRYLETHWVAILHTASGVQVFDINAVAVGGWLSCLLWEKRYVPWIIKECVPRGDGTWWPTHLLKISRPASEANDEENWKDGAGSDIRIPVRQEN